MTYGINRNISTSYTFSNIDDLEEEFAQELQKEIDKELIENLMRVSRDLIFNETINNAIDTNFKGLKDVDAGLFCKKEVDNK